MLTNKNIDVFYLIVVFVLWGSSSYLISQFASPNYAFLFVLLMVVSSSFIQYIFLKFKKINIIEELKKYKTKNILQLIIPASFGLLVFPLMYFLGISSGTPIRANAFIYLWPFFTLITHTILLRKIPRKYDILAIIIAFTGSIFVLYRNIFDLSNLFNDSIDYVIYSLIAAVSFGIYTCFTGRFVPISNSETHSKMEHRLRFFLMTIFASTLLIFISIPLFATKRIEFMQPPLDLNATVCFILYIFNFTIAHYLWNRVNTSLSAAYTSTIAFSVPFLSTLLLSFLGGTKIDFSIAIGFIFIIVGIAIMHRKVINSVNGTILASFVIFLLLYMIPFSNNSNTVTSSHSFLQITLALFAIFNGFLFFRVSSNYKELEQYIDKLQVIKKKYSNIDVNLLKADSIILTKEKEDNTVQKTLLNTLQPSASRNYDNELLETYLLIYRARTKSISISEWIVIILLAVSIAILSFITRESSFISDFMTFIITLSMVLCCLILFEQNHKKETLIKSSFSVSIESILIKTII